jgi:hypothetical protein
MEMGVSEYTDGIWLYPEGFLHYVRRHAVKPPQEFLDHVCRKKYQVAAPWLDTIARDEN